MSEPKPTAKQLAEKLLTKYQLPKERTAPDEYTFAVKLGTGGLILGDARPKLPPQPEPEPVASEIIAWRGWNFCEKSTWTPLLRSVTKDTRWHGPVLTADLVPTRHGKHGVYALREKPTPDHRQATYIYGCAVYGQVALSGVVVEGEHGYRAERAIIRELWVGNPAHRGEVGDRFCAWELAGMLSDRYGVDVDVAADDWSAHPAQPMGILSFAAPQWGFNIVGGK